MRTLTLLYVEDHALVQSYVRELLMAEGWHVETCQDAMSALEKLESGVSYDVLIFDESLPGMSGFELVGRARRLTHRRRTPIIILSADDTARAALRAGADVSLRKPEDVSIIILTIKGLVGMC
jgi:DNA-binding response OmpR family regulator